MGKHGNKLINRCKHWTFVAFVGEVGGKSTGSYTKNMGFQLMFIFRF
jgi:hypothetical protein